MWPFRRSSVRPRQARHDVVVHRAMRTDWQSTAPMPIVQARTFAAVDGGFEQILTTRRQPTFLGPLGHELNPSAPRGVVSGLARPTPDVAGGGVVQRTFAAPRHGWTPFADSSAPVEDVDDEPSSTSGVDPTSESDSVATLLATGSPAPVEAPPASSATHLPLATQRAVLDGSSTSSTTPAAETSPAAPSRSATPSSSQSDQLPRAPSTTPDAGPVRLQAREPMSVPLSTQRAPLTAGNPAAVPAGGAEAVAAPSPPIQRAPQAASTQDRGPDASATEERASSVPTESPAAGAVADPQADAAASAASELAPPPSIDAAPKVVPTVGATPVLGAPADAGRALTPQPAVTTSARTFAVQRRTRIGSPLDHEPHPTLAASTGRLETARHTPPAVAPFGSPAPPAGATATSPAPMPTGPGAGPVVSRTVAAPLPPVHHASDVQPIPKEVATVWTSTDHTSGMWTESRASDVAAGNPAATVALLAARPLVTTTARRAIDSQMPSTGPSAATIQRSPAATAPAGSATALPALARSAGLPVPALATVHAPARAVQRSTVERTRGQTSRSAATASVPPMHSTPGDQEGGAPVIDFGGFQPAADGTLWAADTAREADGNIVAIQRAGDDAGDVAPPSAPASTGSPVVATPTAGPAARTAGAPPSDAQIQELCRALYAPLHRRLCRDLLVDRERSGYRTDIRF